MRFLFLEAFCGGSHRDFAIGLAEHSRHVIERVSLPARFWKWRMRGAALHFARTVNSLDGIDGLICSGMMSLADFTALCRGRRPPALLYLHENQLTYPLAPGERRDLQFGFTDITSALSADRILFNSRFHHDCFFAALPDFINRMPEFKPHWAVDAIRQKSAILHPGCRFDDAPDEPSPLPAGPPLVVWNHRWEFDKAPEIFFDALDTVAEMGVDFRLAMLGETYQSAPEAFAAARDRLGEKIVQYGFVRDRAAYQGWLKRGLVAVSTAIQENFGIAMVEAMRFGCLPLLPKRLAYPEVLPKEFHADFLYRDRHDLIARLAGMLTHPERYLHHRPVLSAMMARHAWPATIHRYDRELERLAEADSKARGGSGHSTGI